MKISRITKPLCLIMAVLIFSSALSVNICAEINNGAVEEIFPDDVIVPAKTLRSDTNIVDCPDGIYTYKEMKADIKELQKNYSDIMQYKVIGVTADKRNIYDIIIGDPDADKQIVVQAGCHGREYMTSLLAMEQVEYYLNGYYSKKYKGVSFRKLFSQYAIHIIPMLNPDGVTISQLGVKGINNKTLRNNLNTIYHNDVVRNYTKYKKDKDRYFQRWKANAKGVDINRNFDGKWKSIEALEGASALNYKGKAPESEVESKSITKLISSLSDPITVISYHASGSVLWWDYGQTGEFRKRCEKQMNVVSKLTGYKLQPYEKNSAGGLCDWIIEDMNGAVIPELIEIGEGETPLDYSEFKDIWKRNKLLIPALTYLYYDEE